MHDVLKKTQYSIKKNSMHTKRCNQIITLWIATESNHEASEASHLYFFSLGCLVQPDPWPSISNTSDTKSVKEVKICCCFHFTSQQQYRTNFLHPQFLHPHTNLKKYILYKTLQSTLNTIIYNIKHTSS